MKYVDYLNDGNVSTGFRLSSQGEHSFMIFFIFLCSDSDLQREDTRIHLPSLRENSGNTAIEFNDLMGACRDEDVSTQTECLWSHLKAAANHRIIRLSA